MIVAWLKRLFARPQEEVVLERVCIDAGILEECPVCHTVADKQHDARLNIADELLEQRIGAHDPALARFGSNTDAAKRALRALRERYPFSCLCESTG